MLPPADRMAPEIRAVVDYWSSLRQGGGLPGFRQLDPAALGALLPGIWVLDVVRDPYRFRFRLIGEQVLDSRPTLPLDDAGTAGRGTAMPTPRKGMFLDEYHGGPLPPRMFEGFVRAVECHEPDWYEGTPLTRHTRWIKALERVTLPLAENGRDVDALLNLTLYRRR